MYMRSRRVAGILLASTALLLLLHHSLLPPAPPLPPPAPPHNSTAPERHHHRLLIGVLSARHHRRHRDTIRETWGSRLPSGVKVLFAVGSTGCPEEQRTQWACKLPHPAPDAKEAKLSRELREEAERHGDVVLVDMVDTYRGLPQKLRLLYRHLRRHHRYDYVLKVDDDTYVNPERALRHIAAAEVPLEGAWFGHMRCDWGVNRDGKWAEPDYTAGRYPCFGGGGGNVLTSDLAGWVGDNAGVLRDYQGEDVSMGIWLAAVKHRRIVDDHFHVLQEGGCDPDMASSPSRPRHQSGSSTAGGSSAAASAPCAR